MDVIDRPFGCHYCDARFTRKEHKIRHEQIHVPRQHFVCWRCSRLFQRKDVLLRHERLVHRTSRLSNEVMMSGSQTAAVVEFGSNAEQIVAGNDLSSQEPTGTAQTPSRRGQFPEAGRREYLSPSDGAMLISPASLGLDDWLRDPQHCETIRHSDIESLALLFPYTMPMPSFDTSISGDDLILDVDQIGEGCSDSPVRLPGLQAAPLTEPRLLEKLSWLVGSQSRPIPNIELEKTWIRFVPPDSVIQYSPCSADLSVSVSGSVIQRALRFYFMLFHPHAAIIHIPTFRASACHHVLLLAMAAIGAAYSHNRSQARELYKAASSSLEKHQCEMAPTARLQTFLLLSIYACWSDHPEMQQRYSILSSMTRSYLVSQGYSMQSSLCNEWHRWIERECLKRTVCFSYWFLSVMKVSTKSMANTMRDQNISLELPYEESFWQCEDEIKWLTMRSSVPTPPTFANSFGALMSSEQVMPASISLFGFAVLICALFSQVDHLNSLASGASSDATKTLLQFCDAAMGKWKAALQEGVIQHSKTGGGNISMAEAAVALWNVTMMHIQADVGIVEISQLILSCPDEESLSQLIRAVPRSLQMSKAMHHAVEFVRGPASLGINFLARTGCCNLNPCLAGLGFHCVILLAQWLHTLENITAAEAGAVLTPEEFYVIGMVQEVVSNSGVLELENLDLPLSESCLKIWREAMGFERLIWEFNETRRQLLRPEVLFLMERTDISNCR